MNPADDKNRNGSMMRNALRLCERMASNAVEFALIVRLVKIVDEFGEPHRALREPVAVRTILGIDEELLLHARPVMHRIVLSAVEEASQDFVPGLDKDGWVQVLLVALEVDDPPANVIPLDAWRRRTPAPADECSGKYSDE